MKIIKSTAKRILPKPWVAYIIKKRYLKALRGHYIAEFDLLQCIIKKGDAVIDVGANFGWYTKIMSRIVEEQGKVFSVEPVPINYSVLTYIVKNLCKGNVHTFQCAISDREGVQTMAVPLSELGDERLYEAMIVKDNVKTDAHVIRVETKTLDSLISSHDIKNLTYIKCDVEGHELQCLKGAQKIIEHYHPVWQVEIWGDPEDKTSPAYETFELFEQAGYLPHIFNGYSLSKRKKGEKKIEYYFLTPSHIKVLKNSHPDRIKIE